MSATYISQAIEQLKSNIFMHVRHRALLHYTGEPMLNNHQLFFIQLPFLNGEILNDNHTVSATTVGIVHASLTEHDKIQEQDATSKEQQLTVLSGDYYSGRYYQLLAQTGNILLIQKLSKGIVYRCEHQIKVYESAQRTFAEWVDSLTVIECELIAQYYGVYGFERYTAIMEQTLTIKRLQVELTLLNQQQPTLFGQVLQKSEKLAHSVQDELHREIMMRKGALDTQLHSSTALKEELKQYIRHLTAIISDEERF
jgi:heptaprenyl diphosphate synthase